MELYRLIYKKRVDTIFVLSADRLFPGARTLLEIILEEHGTKIWCMDDEKLRRTETQKLEADRGAAYYSLHHKNLHARRK